MNEILTGLLSLYILGTYIKIKFCFNLKLNFCFKKQWPDSQSHDNWYTQQQQYQQIPNDASSTQQHSGYWQQSYNSQPFNQQYEHNQYQSQYQPE